MILSKVKNTFNKYRGLSTEEKPTNIPQHSSFLETDTGATYNYDGLQWNLEESGGSGGESSGGGALYLTSTLESDAIVLSASYNDILAAIADNKAVFVTVVQNGGVMNVTQYFPLVRIFYIPAAADAAAVYVAVFAEFAHEGTELYQFGANTPTDPLSFLLDNGGGDGGNDDGEQH